MQARHQLVELRELGGFERVEALAGEPLLVARHRQRHLDLGAVASSPVPGGAGDAAARLPPGAAVCSARRPVVGRRGGRSRVVVGLERLVASRLAEDREEDRVERLDLRRVGDEHGARGPVQAPAADRAHERERAREVRRPYGLQCRLHRLFDSPSTITIGPRTIR